MSEHAGEFHNGDNMRITAGSAADIAHIVFFGSGGDSAVQLLLQREDDPEHPLPYTYAGRHMGMPRHNIWAITRDSSSIAVCIPDIIRDAQQAAEATQNQ